MSHIQIIRTLVKDGLYYLTEHADDELAEDGFNIFDLERAMMTGRIRKTWPYEGKVEIIGRGYDGRSWGVVCRVTGGGKVRIITTYEDKPKP